MKFKLSALNFVKTTEFLAAAASALAVLSGAALQAALTTKRLEEKYRDISEKEIAEAKLYYSRVLDKDGYDDPVAMLAATNAGVAQELIESLGYAREEHPDAPVRGQHVLDPEEAAELVDDVVEMATVKRIFDNDEDEEVGEPIAAPLEAKVKDPYIITAEEWHRNELDYEQFTLEYYTEDDTLVDERGKPQDDEVLGPNALEQFGFRSKRADLVYVRNEKLQIDFEVIRVQGSYSEQVAGFTERGDDKRPRKFREERST